MMVDGLVCERYLLVNWCDVIWRQGGSQWRFVRKPKISDNIKSRQWVINHIHIGSELRDQNTKMTNIYDRQWQWLGVREAADGWD